MDNKGMNAEPPVVHFPLEHQPRRRGYAKRSPTRHDMRIASIWLVLIAAFATSAPLFADTFGHRQLAQLLDDRPDMKGILADDNPLRSWVHARFESDLHGLRVHWDNREPTGGFDSAMFPPSAETPGIVRVSSSPSLTGRDKWCLLVYELENLANAPRIAELVAKAHGNRIERDAFSIECIRLEHAAVLRTQKVLSQFGSLGPPELRSRRYGRLNAMPTDFQAYLDFLDADPDTQYRNHFRLYFDQITSHASTSSSSN